MDTSRNCPKCDIIVIYSSIYKKNRAINENSVCRKCAMANRRGSNHPLFGKEAPFKGKKHSDHSRELISKNHADVSGDKNPMFGKGGMLGKKHKEESKLKIGESNKNKIISKDTAQKISNSLKEYYKNNDSPTKGRKHTDETKLKMRLSAIKRVERDKFNGNQFYPSYNKDSIRIIEKYASENNLYVVHAENGGEFYIKELGYWVDAYDINNNVVIEYYEKHHFYNKDKDTIRRELIIDHLGCEFIIIYENGSIEKYKQIK